MTNGSNIIRVDDDVYAALLDWVCAIEAARSRRVSMNDAARVALGVDEIKEDN